MDGWSHEERKNQKRICERISKSSTSDKEDRRESGTDILRDGTNVPTKNNVRCTSTRKETERKTQNQVERLV